MWIIVRVRVIRVIKMKETIRLEQMMRMNGTKHRVWMDKMSLMLWTVWLSMLRMGSVTGTTGLRCTRIALFLRPGSNTTYYRL